jgi:carbonic anhydrase
MFVNMAPVALLRLLHPVAFVVMAARLATKEIILIHHTDCGMLTFTDDEFKEGIS